MMQLLVQWCPQRWELIAGCLPCRPLPGSQNCWEGVTILHGQGQDRIVGTSTWIWMDGEGDPAPEHGLIWTTTHQSGSRQCRFTSTPSILPYWNFFLGMLTSHETRSSGGLLLHCCWSPVVLRVSLSSLYLETFLVCELVEQNPGKAFLF